MKRIAFALWLVAWVANAQAQTPEPSPPSASLDAPEVDARFEQAMSDFAGGKFADAAAGFEDVAARTNDPARQATATEMAKQARTRITATPLSASPANTTAVPPADASINATPQDARLDDKSREGRYVLLIGSTMMGLGLYGPTLAVLADSSNDKTSVGMYMLGAGSSFFIPYMLTRDEPVSWGMADAWLYGSSRGALHGFFLLALAGDNSDPSEQAVLGTLSLASLAEGTGFTLWARATNASAGLTNSMGHGSDFGVGYALGLSSLVLPDDSLGMRWAGLAGLSGAALGYGAGLWYGNLRKPTWGDGEVLRTAGLLGAYAAVLPLIYGEVENRQVIAGMLLGGATVGLYAGDRLLDGHDFTTGQGIVTELSTVAGGLAGGGLGYLLSPDDNDDAMLKLIASGAILGAAGGFMLTYLGLDTQARPNPQSPPSMTLHIGPDLAHDRTGIVAAGTF